MTDEQVLMLTRERIARLADVSERRLAYWEQTGLLRSTVETTLAGSRTVRLYDFQAALTAVVLAALRERVSLQHIRQIVAHLQRIEFEVTEVGFATAGPRVHFQLPDGAWGDVTDPGQFEFHEVLDLRPLRAAVLGASRRADGQHGQIERRRGVRGSKPVIAGTRVPVSSVQAYLAAGSTSEEILLAYPDLTIQDVDAVRGLASA